MNPAWQDSEFPWPAPAKINLFLHITGRRADGYHLLQTVFQFLDISDYLYFKIRDDGEIHRVSDLAGVPEDQDLVVRAAKRLQASTGCRMGVDIRVDKRLPMGGGLGGGSSDAATVLVALNKLWQTGLSQQALAEMGLQLGADVPIFVYGHAAWAESVGEQFSSVNPSEPYYVLLNPGVSVNTAEIFSAPELTRDKHPLKIRDSLDRQFENVCQPVVAKRYPEVAKALEWLTKRSQSEAKMTGTGACLFASFESEAAAKEVARQCPEAWQCHVVKGMNISLLQQVLQKS